MRNVYEKGIFTELTQGAIINNCISEDYNNCEVWGCVITPRCDMANDGKVSTFHYLPIIDFEYWVDKVMKDMLINDYNANLKDKINKKLEISGAGNNLVDVFNEKEVILKAGRATMKDKDYSSFEKICVQYFDGDAEEEKKYLLEDGHYKTILKNLTTNGIHGCYLIESWENHSDYKIILLRDIRRMSISTRYYYENWINRGFEDADFYKKNDVSDSLHYKNHYQILRCIKSPFIENIMQSFSYNFTRVGIPSFEDEVITSLSSIIKIVLSEGLI